MRSVDLNADLGETVDGVPTADDAAMFAVVTSANIACGGHAGDADTMRASVLLAARAGVATGAHPAYPDPANFGRVSMDITPAALAAALDAQLQAFTDAGADVRYVKPHGALYNDIVDDTDRATVVAAAVRHLSDRLGRDVPLLGLGGEVARAAAAVGLPFIREAFLDRGYTAQGTLVPRADEGALLHDVDAVAERALRMAVEGSVVAVTGETVPIAAASFCVHGDTPAAVEMARAVRTRLETAGVVIAAPWT